MPKRDDLHRLEQLVREMESVPDPALKMRVAELVAELADLRWVLTRRAEAAGSIPGVVADPPTVARHD